MLQHPNKLSFPADDFELMGLKQIASLHKAIIDHADEKVFSTINSSIHLKIHVMLSRADT